MAYDKAQSPLAARQTAYEEPSAGHGTPALRALKIPGHKLATGTHLRETLSGLPRLEHLDVSRSSVTTNETLRNLDGGEGGNLDVCLRRGPMHVHATRVVFKKKKKTTFARLTKNHHVQLSMRFSFFYLSPPMSATVCMNPRVSHTSCGFDPLRSLS